MVYLYRFTINEGNLGGCVLALDEVAAIEKVRAAYEKKPEIIETYGKDLNIKAWIDDEIAPDLVQVYP